jgi:hypothetical protein
VAELHILQDGNDITRTTHPEIVGKRINLASEVLPQDLPVNSHQWQIPGEKVKDFVVSQDFTSGHKVDLASADLNDASLDFCWVDGADGRVVSCQVGTPLGAAGGQATFDVKRPTGTVSSEIGQAEINEFGGDFVYALRLGSPEDAGVKFECTFQMPEGFEGGNTCFVQVYRRWLQWNGNTPETPWGLDPHRDAAGNPVDWRYQYNANIPVVYADDAPAYPLTIWHNTIEVHDGSTLHVEAPIRMWYMFRPDGPGSVWVPLLLVSWHWSGKAHREFLSNTWVEVALNPADPPATTVTVPTDEWPEWTSIIPLEGQS